MDFILGGLFMSLVAFSNGITCYHCYENLKDNGLGLSLKKQIIEVWDISECNINDIKNSPVKEFGSKQVCIKAITEDDAIIRTGKRRGYCQWDSACYECKTDRCNSAIPIRGTFLVLLMSAVPFFPRSL